MSEPLLLIDKQEPGIWSLTLNRPDRRNALTIGLMEELCAAVTSAESDPSSRAVVLQGAGPAFCSGLDLKEAQSAEVRERSARWVAWTLRTIHECGLVTIAAAHGAALAGGAGLLSTCDLVVAAEDLSIGFPEVRRGLVPALVLTLLGRQVRDRDLRELVLLGEPVSASRAMAMGLVHCVVPPSQLREQARQLALKVAQGAPRAIRETKWLIDRLTARPLADELAEALQLHQAARQSEEAQEGVAAFLEKRSPNWARLDCRPQRKNESPTESPVAAGPAARPE